MQLMPMINWCLWFQRKKVIKPIWFVLDIATASTMYYTVSDSLNFYNETTFLVRICAFNQHNLHIQVAAVCTAS